MSTPSSSTWPDSAAPGTSSCIRLRIRRKVDLPHPDGPMRAVTFPAGISRSTRSSTLRCPNQADTLSASRLAVVGDGVTGMTVVLLVSRSAAMTASVACAPMALLLRSGPRGAGAGDRHHAGPRHFDATFDFADDGR